MLFRSVIDERLLTRFGRERLDYWVPGLTSSVSLSQVVAPNVRIWPVSAGRFRPKAATLEESQTTPQSLVQASCQRP